MQLYHLLPNAVPFLGFAELVGVVLLPPHADLDAHLRVVLCNQVPKCHIQGRISTLFFFHQNAFRENSRQDYGKYSKTCIPHFVQLGVICGPEDTRDLPPQYYHVQRNCLLHMCLSPWEHMERIFFSGSEEK